MKIQFMNRVTKVAAIMLIATGSMVIAPTVKAADLSGASGSSLAGGLPGIGSGSTPNPFICSQGGPDCLIAGYGQSQLQWLVQPPMALPQTMAGNRAIRQLPPQIMASQSAMTSQSVITTLTAIDPSSIMQNAVTSILSPLTPPLSGAQQMMCNVPGFSSPACSANLPPIVQTANYNLDSLLVPLSYQVISIPASSSNSGQGLFSKGTSSSIDQDQAAQNFIQLVSGLTQPMPVVDFSKVPPDQMTTLLTRPDVVNYLTSLRTYAAQQAVGLSNLYHFYAERKPIPGLAQMAGLPSLPGKPAPAASPLQVEEFYANRRINDAKWYRDLQNASPAAVDKEMVILLAEIRSEMFKNRIEMERMTATLSVMELQQAQAAKTMLGQTANSVKDPLQPPPNPATQGQ